MYVLCMYVCVCVFGCNKIKNIYAVYRSLLQKYFIFRFNSYNILLQLESLFS